MSTENDVARSLRSWLRENRHEDADRVLDAVFDQVPTTPQRRAGWLARRFPIMNSNVFRIGIAAAVVVLAIIVAAKVLPGSNTGSPNATPSTIQTPTVAPTASIQPIPTGHRGALDPGTYLAGDPFSLAVTFTLPAGWVGTIGGPYSVDLGWAEGPGGISFSIFDKVSVDPCQSEVGYLDPPPASVDELATALADMPGVVVRDVSDASVDGYSGTQLTMSAPDSFAGCTFSSLSDGFVIWQLPLGKTFSMSAGETDGVWILDVAGTRLVIVVSEDPGFTDQQRAELQAVFDSIRIEPAT